MTCDVNKSAAQMSTRLCSFTLYSVNVGTQNGLSCNVQERQDYFIGEETCRLLNVSKYTGTYVVNREATSRRRVHLAME